MMMRTKWMRLGVRDPADILRWAGGQDTRQLDNFRYRTIRGREFVSFRMVPRYAIEIGTSDIVVVAHVNPGPLHRLSTAVSALCRMTARKMSSWASETIAALKPQLALEAPARTAELYQLAPARARLPSHR